MILNRTGAEFEHEGVTYTIGGAIVGTAESEYAGLYGRINAIHDGEDKETENETPDIYCEFDPPVMPHEVKALEDTLAHHAICKNTANNPHRLYFKGQKLYH